MDRISLKATERELLGKKVKNLRKEGFIPGHVYGKKTETEHVTVKALEFLKVLAEAGETGLVDLKIGEEKVRPVLIRGMQHDPVRGGLLHIDFYQVNLSEKVQVPVPVVLIGEEPEGVHMGEVVVLQNLSEVQVEALPTDLIEKIEVDITTLKNVEDTITVAQLNYDHSIVTVLAEPEEVVVKLAPAITEEMKKLMEEQAAEAAAAAEAATAEEGGEAPAAEGEEGAEGEKAEGGEEGSIPEGGKTPAEEKSKEE